MSMITFEDLYKAYTDYDSRSRKTPAQAEYRLRWASNLLELRDVLNNSRPLFNTYAFTVTVPRPREVFASEVDQCILDHYCDMRLRPLLEKRLSVHTYNNRTGKGQQACINAVMDDIFESSDGFSSDAWIIKVDLQGCFPNIVQQTAYDQLRELVEDDYNSSDKEDFLYVMQLCCFADSTTYCRKLPPVHGWDAIPRDKSLFNKPDGTGAVIGRDFWQLAVGWYFHSIDEWLESMGVTFERYVDDIYIISRSKDALLLLPELRERLKLLGATLHPRKFYCQHYSKGVECLGYHLKYGRIHPNKRVIARALMRVRKYNRLISADIAGNMVATLNPVLGICRGATAVKEALRIVGEIDRRWFEFIEWDSRKKCLKVRKQYTNRNQVIFKYHLS